MTKPTTPTQPVEDLPLGQGMADFTGSLTESVQHRFMSMLKQANTTNPLEDLPLGLGMEAHALATILVESVPPDTMQYVYARLAEVKTGLVSASSAEKQAL